MKNKKILALIVILIVLGVGFRLLSLGNEFTAEETDFVKPAIAIAQTGHPVFYIAEQQPLETALWHPPMYIYSMALLFKIFSINEIVARSTNVFVSLFIAILIFVFCLKIIDGEEGKTIGLISSAFFLFNYYILSSSVLIDIDVLSAFFMLGFVYSILRFYQTKEKKFLYLSGVFLFFGIWNRYIAAFLIYVAVGVYYLVNKDLRKNFKEYFLVGVVAGVCFVLSWTGYVFLFEPGNLFSFIEHNTQLGVSQISSFSVYVGSFVINIAQFIRLFTFPATILLIWSCFYFVKNESKLMKILLIYAVSILLFFIMIPRPAFGYTRYFMSAFPAVSILIGSFIYVKLKNKGFSWEIIPVLVFCVLSLIYLILVNPQLTIYNSKGLILATNLPDFAFNVLGSFPLVFSLFFRDKKKMFLLTLIGLMIVYSLFFNVGYLMHEPDIREVGEYLQNVTAEGDIVMVPKAVGYYYGGRFYQNDNNKPKIEFSLSEVLEYVRKSYENPEMDDNFFWNKDFNESLFLIDVGLENLDKVKYVVTYYDAENETPDRKIGDFYVYNLE